MNSPIRRESLLSAPETVRRTGREVEVRGLWKSYGQDTYAVRNVSFKLQRGEFLTLLGPSGSGKTTCLMMIAGFEAPARGEILVDGRNIAGQPPEDRNFGVVFQGYALFPHKTVFENVEFGLRMKRVPAVIRRRQVLDILDKVGLAGFTSRKPRELSGGQQQRVALARALVFEPDALLLDEPLGALDRKLRESLQSEIKEIQRRFGISILFVTHDQDEAMMMSDRIAVMAEGRIVQIGSPADVYLHPATPFVAGFLGETNLFPGVFKGIEKCHAIVEFQHGTLGRARLQADGRPRVAGDKVLVSIRPERLRLFQHKDAPVYDGAAVEARITECTFLGRHACYRMRSLDQSVSVSVTEWSPATALPPGTVVRLGWAADDAQILGEPDSRLP